MPLDAEQLTCLIRNQAACLRIWIGGRCSSAEDVVQEAFCRLARQDPIPDHPVAWLYRVCLNLAEKQRISDQRRKRRETQRAATTAASGALSDQLELQEMLAAVEQLPSSLREVLVARIWGQLSLEEVGQLCGTSTATAFRRYQEALKTLRNTLDVTCEKS